MKVIFADICAFVPFQIFLPSIQFERNERSTASCNLRIFIFRWTWILIKMWNEKKEKKNICLRVAAWIVQIFVVIKYGASMKRINGIFKVIERVIWSPVFVIFWNLYSYIYSYRGLITRDKFREKPGLSV